MYSKINEFPRDLRTFALEGEFGALETMTDWPKQAPEGVAIICHPHPLHQGTMHNKVVTTLARACSELNLATVRFNFRGVGNSAGVYGDVAGEIADLRTVLAWVRSVVPDLPVWLLGFSFGSYISAAVANDTEIAKLVSVAPAVNHMDYHKLSDIACPWLVVAAEADEIVPFADIQAFVDNAPAKLKFEVISGASHFMHGKLLELREIVKAFA